MTTTEAELQEMLAGIASAEHWLHVAKKDATIAAMHLGIGSRSSDTFCKSAQSFVDTAHSILSKLASRGT